jgi:hypothetical protein
MPCGRGFSLVVAILLGMVSQPLLPAAWAGENPPVSVLARSAPADTRLFFEVHGIESLSDTPIGYVMTRMVSGLVTATRPASTGPAASQPASAPAGWRDWFSETVGLGSRRVADLLFNGPVAFAADGWSGLGDAVLLAEPKDVASLEAALASQRVPAAQKAKVRHYRLASEQELASDGRSVVVGRSANRSGLFARTVSLWESEGGASLADMKEFQERTAGLPAGVQLVFYAGTSTRIVEGGLLMGQWWPADWPRLRALAVGAGISPGGVTVDADGRMEMEQKEPAPPPVAVESLLRLPSSVVIAWTEPVDFVEAFRQIASEDWETILPMLLADLPPTAMEWQLFSHFVGNAIFVVAQGPGDRPNSRPSPVAASAPSTTSAARGSASTQTAPASRASTSTAPESRPAASGPAPATQVVSGSRPSTHSAVAETQPSTRPAAIAGPAGQPVEAQAVMPVLAMLVETDDPHAVESVLERLTLNLQRMMADSASGGVVRQVRREAEAGGGQIVSLSLGQLFAPASRCPFLRTLEISWIIADRWLIIGTNSETVRQLAAARRGEGRLLPPALVPKPVLDAAQAGWAGQMLLLGQPRALGGMIDSWVTYISARYPEMLRPEWWRGLERKQRSTRVQLGVIPTTRTIPGAVEVMQTLPDYPAFGVLQPGDLILQVNGRPLSPEAPVRSLREMLAAADESGKVTLRVRRNAQDQNLVVSMPLPEEALHPVQPIRLLGQVAQFLKLFPSASYAVWRPSPGLLKAHLELRFSTATQPGP